ncbi:light-harvesting complex assembly protein PucC [Rhodobacter capsulatus]|uniref:Protein PucC-2 n=2 Tax=Rhodobacter capsulatus TaxID=1061 RepID=D5AMI6_RHOCB|nr:light-harvesting complex assembly protein PucC [Rhodobacter capsulatus]ADE86262.1 protein PucC-2 [Rhodobacter capsulatus SB 1003]ETD00879.1 protein pucC [Rhodobacter capsulatus DE442]ETD75175.1 protein pucC [Rhodobacter capsulatus R121]ETE52915.1 protein pucC [Rhodobacter capsulatus Y262]MDS0928075.1 light-harvesting complex assembly protein PucC [Rhodobacter capsulatus]
MGYRAFALKNLARHAPKYLPFADVASEEVPLSRLLRLSLFQITVGMTLTLLAGTLNRVMIVELAVPASLVSVMLAMPMLFAPFRTLIGFKSDTHKSALGLRRAPWIWKGTIYQFGGFAIMPFALLVLSGFGESVDAPRWIGMSAAALAFLLVGAGVHIVQTAGLALATDLVAEEDQPKVVGLMYVMLLFGMVISALTYGALLADYTPGRLIQVIQGTALMSVVLNMAAMWKQEAVSRERARQMETAQHPTFQEAFGLLMGRPGMLALLTVIALGTFGFGMADVLLEPYGGQALHLTVGETTKLTALFALGTLAGFGTASRVLGNGARPMPLAVLGALIGVPGFVAIILSSLISQGGIWLFLVGTFAVGLGIGLFGHATLTATMRTAPADRIGLALGAWGAVQATAAGVGVALAGVVRDGLVALPGTFGSGVAGPYNTVFAIEAVILIVAIAFAVPLVRRGGR